MERNSSRSAQEIGLAAMQDQTAQIAVALQGWYGHPGPSHEPHLLPRNADDSDEDAPDTMDGDVRPGARIRSCLAGARRKQAHHGGVHGVTARIPRDLDPDRRGEG